MASIYGTRRTTDERSGGKIVRGRRIAAYKTPYDRPTPAEATPTRAPPQNPNWLTGLIFPTSRMIATGATKLLSSVFGPDSSSSSSSSSGSGSSSEDDIDDENDNYHIPCDGVDGLNKKNGTTSELIGCFRKEPQLTIGKSETKHVIETLLMQETFSREECDRLIKIINSRVIDDSTIEEGQDKKRLRGIPSRTVDYDVYNNTSYTDSRELCSKAVMEAKQWLEEKKVASSSKSDLDHGTCTLNSVMLPQVTKGGLGSPVDMAKWYMRARPPWASPKNYVESRTPSPMGREILMEETPSVAGNSLSSSKKMYSLGSGSWNIQEEIRRVRSKATEDMLKTLPSTKIDLSSFALEPKSIQKSLLAGKTELGRGDKVKDLNLLPATKSIDASPELAAGVTTCHSIPVSVVEMTQDSSWNEDPSLQPEIFPSVQNQDLKAIRTVEGEELAASKSHHQTIPDLALEQDSRLTDRTCSTAKEETESRGKQNANGFPSSGYSLFAGNKEANPRHSDDESPNQVDSSHGKLVNSVPPGEETCELLREASVDVLPVLYDTNSIASGSDHSSGMPREELSKELKQLNPELTTGETPNVVEKQQGRRPSRYNMRSKGREGR